MLDPVKLEPAVATVAVTSNQPGTLVLIDGLQRGVAPMTISDVCEGQHLVELKSASGRYFQRVDARTGQKINDRRHAAARRLRWSRPAARPRSTPTCG